MCTDLLDHYNYRYLQSLKSVDFIKHYIFPGSFIPCISRLCSSASSAKLQLQQLTCFGSSYATTLNHWRQKFLSQQTEILKQGYDQEFIRLWEFYLAYCEAGFRENATDVTHMLLCKQGPGHASAIQS